MTDAELDAVCARHGIILEHDEDGHHAHLTVASGPRLLTEFRESAADAVCALLKDRWGIRTQCIDGRSTAFTQKKSGAIAVLRDGDTELAAVVALADRLAGVAT